MRRVASQILFSSVAVISAYSQIPSKPEFDKSMLIGSWEGKDTKGVTGSLQFQIGGFVVLAMNGERIGGSIPNGPSLRYEIDSSKSPMWIDLVGFDAKGVERGRMKGILLIKNEKEIRVCIGDDPSIRPAKFDDSDSANTMTLKKVY